MVFTSSFLLCGYSLVVEPAPCECLGNVQASLVCPSMQPQRISRWATLIIGVKHVGKAMPFSPAMEWPVKKNTYKIIYGDDWGMVCEKPTLFNVRRF